MKRTLSLLLALSLLTLAGCGAAPSEHIKQALSAIGDSAEQSLVERIQQSNEPEVVFEQTVTPLSIYGTLDETDKQLYDGMYAAFMLLEDYTYYDTSHIGSYSDDVKQQLSDMCDIILIDHPEIFWTAGGSTIHFTPPNTYRYEPDYQYTQQEIDDLTQMTNDAIDELVASVTAESDFDKAVWAYEWLIRNVEYDNELAAQTDVTPETAAARCAPGVFLSHSSVCSGYARAFQMLMQRMDIPCTYVTGYVEAYQAHAWNIVMLDGACYHLDATWDDPSFEGEADASPARISHRYFGLTDAEITQNRTIDHPERYPTCTQTDCNYFVHTGRYFDTLDDAGIGAILENAWNSGSASAEFRFASRQLLEAAEARYLDGGVILSIAPYLGGELRYHLDPVTNVFSIYFA